MDAVNQIPNESPLVVLAGNIATGKTTFAKQLGDHFGWWVGLECLDDNPYLEDFYCDMSNWSFNVEVSFLENRYRLHMEAMSKIYGSVLDRSIYEDRHVFVEASREQGILSKRDYQTYMSLFSAVVSNLQKPDLFIVLSAPIPILMERIAQRGRPFERGIPISYLELLHRHYELWIESLPSDRVVRIDSNIYNLTDDSMCPTETAGPLCLVSAALKKLGIVSGKDSLAQ